MEFDSVRFYNTLVHSMSDAVIYAEAQGRIQFWNSGAVRIFGFSEQEGESSESYQFLRGENNGRLPGCSRDTHCGALLD
jgi:PAS domain S-box-containing protein